MKSRIISELSLLTLHSKSIKNVTNLDLENKNEYVSCLLTLNENFENFNKTTLGKIENLKMKYSDLVEVFLKDPEDNIINSSDLWLLKELNQPVMEYFKKNNKKLLKEEEEKKQNLLYYGGSEKDIFDLIKNEKDFSQMFFEVLKLYPTFEDAKKESLRHNSGRVLSFSVSPSAKFKEMTIEHSNEVYKSLSYSLIESIESMGFDGFYFKEKSNENIIAYFIIMPNSININKMEYTDAFREAIENYAKFASSIYEKIFMKVFTKERLDDMYNEMMKKNPDVRMKNAIDFFYKERLKNIEKKDMVSEVRKMVFEKMTSLNEERQLLYTAVIVDDENDFIQKIQKSLNEIGKFEELENFSHEPKDYHMTVLFGKKLPERRRHEDLGEKVNLNITGIGISKEAIAARVEGDYISERENQHITLAFNTEPRASNDIDWDNKEREEYFPFANPFSIVGTISEEYLDDEAL